MSRYVTIRANSIDEAMQHAKRRFGPAAVVIDTRTVKAKKSDGMNIDSVMELVVDPGPALSRERGEPAPRFIDLTGGKTEEPVQLERVRREIERIERLIRSVENAEAQLRSFDTGYPLNEELIAGGVSEGALRVLQHAFEERVPAAMRGQPDTARHHLLDYLKCATARTFTDISGPHAFLGSAGAGKTSLVLKLTAELVRTGRTAALVVAAPYHSGEVRRVEEAASTLMVDAAVATDGAELRRALLLYEDRDALLIDTPCMLSRRRGGAGGIFELIKTSNSLFKHMVCPLTSGTEQLFGELDLYRAWNFDFVALSRIDLARRCGKIVDVVLQRDVTFSFLSYEEDEGPGIQLASPELLFNLISPPSVEPADHGEATEDSGR